MEIRGAEGGEEANLFAGDLYDMYRGYAARRAGRSRCCRRTRSDLGGINQRDDGRSAATRRGAS